MKEQKQNNSTWIIEELDEWLLKAIKSTEDLCDKADVCSSEYARLLEKNRSFKIVKQKLEDLKFC